MDKDYRNFRFFYEPSKFSERNLIVADAMGYIKSQSFCIDRGAFNNQLVIYVLEGVFHVEQYGESYVMHAGDSAVLQLRHRHRYNTDAKAGAAVIWFHFRGNTVDWMMEGMGREHLLPLVGHTPWLESEIYECFNLVKKRDITYEFEMSARVYKILLDLSKESWMSAMNSNSGTDRQFRLRVTQYIEKNIAGQLTLSDLADHVNLSKYHFCRQFKRQFGCTPFQYISDKRIQMAKQFLQHTDDPLASVAEQLGYVDQSHFSKRFKEAVGIPPSLFRINH